MATSPWYTTRERVLKASGFTESTDLLVDLAITSATRLIEGETHRRFYPETDTRFFDWPPPMTSRSWRLWLEADEIISMTSITVAGDAESTDDFFLEPVNLGPPFNLIETDLDSDVAWSAGTTHQRAIEITGLWGYDNVTESAGTTAEALDASETAVDVTNGGKLGVGDLITVDSERMMVTEVDFADSTAELDDAVTAQKNDTTIPVDDESSFAVGETIRVGDEQMDITSTSTGNLNVIRAVNGTILAAHVSTTTVFANRLVTVERGATGSTAASHLTGAAISKQVYPGLIGQWCIAEAIVELAQQQSAYARTAGSADNVREMREIGLGRIKEEALSSYGRRFRTAVI